MNDLERIDRAARIYRHTVHSKLCNCKACVLLLKALAGPAKPRRRKFHMKKGETVCR